jgi:hypothetical protein
MVADVQDRPTATEILATVGEFLEQDVLPTATGALRYRALVAANLISLLQRELDAGTLAAEEEREALAALLAGTERPAAELESLAELNASLQRRLLEDESLDRAFLVAARDVLERSVRAKLSVNKPGYDRYDMAVEVA